MIDRLHLHITSLIHSPIFRKHEKFLPPILPFLHTHFQTMMVSILFFETEVFKISSTPFLSFFNRYPTTVWVRLFGELLTRLTSSMVTPFLILYLHDKLGGSVLLPMAVVGLQPLSDIVTTLLAGGLTDRIGRKPVIIGALALQMLAMAGMILANTAWLFALLYICNKGLGRIVGNSKKNTPMSNKEDQGVPLGS
jgi:MFS family permease